MATRKNLDTRFLYRDVGSILVPVLVASLVVLALGALASAAPPAQGSPEGLAGDWVLNEKLSDDPREKMQEMMQRGGGRGRPGGGGGGDRPGGGGGRGADGERGRGGRPPMGGVALREPELHITANDRGLLLRGAGDMTQTLVIAGHDTPAAPDAGPVAYWEGPRLVVASGGEQAPPRREIYELVADGTRLVVTFEMQLPDGGDSFTLRRVFDRAPVN